VPRGIRIAKWSILSLGFVPFYDANLRGPAPPNATPTKNTRPDHGLLTIIILDLYFGADVSCSRLVINDESAQSYNMDVSENSGFSPQIIH